MIAIYWKKFLFVVAVLFCSVLFWGCNCFVVGGGGGGGGECVCVCVCVCVKGGEGYGAVYQTK